MDTAVGFLEVAFVTWANVITLLALLITIISGYMVVAYVAAEKMTVAQVVIVNFIYLIMTFFVGLACVEMSKRAALFEAAGYEIAVDQFVFLPPRFDIAMGILGAMGICVIATLKFMWDIRHPKLK
ncbi:MAG: hypothetical protein ABJ013_05115 [Halioglobus sp.]